MAGFEQPPIVSVVLPVKKGAEKRIRGIKLHGTAMWVDADSGAVYSPYFRRGKFVFDEIKGGLFTALRSKRHILERYGVQPGSTGELQNVAWLEARIRSINLALNRVHGEVPPETRAELETFAADLSRVINGFKVEARGQLFAAAPGIDSLGRRNIGASCARLVAASNRLLSRLAQIGIIHPAIAVRRQALLYERDRIKAIADTVLRGLEVQLSTVAFRKPGGDTELQRSLVSARVKQLRQAVFTVYVNPFLPIFSKTGTHLDEAVRLLAEGKTDLAKRRLVWAMMHMARVSRRLR